MTDDNEMPHAATQRGSPIQRTAAALLCDREEQSNNVLYNQQQCALVSPERNAVTVIRASGIVGGSVREEYLGHLCCAGG